MMRFAAALVVILLTVASGACGDDGDDNGGTNVPPGGAFTPGLVTAVTTQDAGLTAVIDAETFVSDRTLPAAALSAERLEDAGSATTADGQTIQMARATSEDVAAWELVSPGEAGWTVWRPQAVLDVMDDAGAGAALVSVEAVDWPDACLGAARADEMCAEVITPGYRIVLEQAGETREYRASRAGQFRRVPSPG